MKSPVGGSPINGGQISCSAIVVGFARVGLARVVVGLVNAGSDCVPFSSDSVNRVKGSFFPERGRMQGRGEAEPGFGCVGSDAMGVASTNGSQVVERAAKQSNQSRIRSGSRIRSRNKGSVPRVGQPIIESKRWFS